MKPFFSRIIDAAMDLSGPCDRRKPLCGGGDPEALVIQRTLRGSVCFRSSGINLVVPEEWAIIYTDQDDIELLPPDDSSAGFRIQRIAFSAPTARPAFDRLRADFGSVLAMSTAGNAGSLLSQIIYRFNHGGMNDAVHRSAQLYRLIMTLYDEQLKKARFRDPIEFGHYFIRHNLVFKINLKDVARQAGVTREYFAREFTRRYGQGPGRYLRTLRLETARNQLRSTHCSVKRIADGCGFASSNSFCRTFRQNYGMSPDEWRRRSRRSSQPSRQRLKEL